MLSRLWENWNSLCTVGGNVKWFRLCGNKYASSSVEAELPCDITTPLLYIYIYLKELKAGIQADIYIPIFITT